MPSSLGRNIERKEKREGLGAEEIPEGDGGEEGREKGCLGDQKLSTNDGEEVPALATSFHPPRPSVNSQQSARVSGIRFNGKLSFFGRLLRS